MSTTESNAGRPKIASLPWGAAVSDVSAVIERDGVVILENALSPEEVRQVNDDLDQAMEALHKGSSKDDEFSKEFHGSLTKRLTNIVTLSKTFREQLIGHPTTLGYVREAFRGVSDTFWLNTAQAIEIHPGEREQLLHRDSGNYPVFNKYGPDAPEVMINMIVALVDITEERAATRIIPGSHKWEFDRPFTPEMTIPAELKAGSVLYYSGKTVHGGGANKTKDFKRRVIVVPYNPGFLLPEEAYPFVVPLEVARTMSPELQQLIGFRSFHQNEPHGGSLWQHNYGELSEYLKL